MTVGCKRRMLHRRAVIYLDAVLTSRSSNFARVELQTSHPMIVLDCLKRATRADVPYPYGLVKTTTGNMDLVKLEAGHGPSVTCKCSVSLPGTHVPHSYCTVATTTYKGIPPELYSPHKILVHLPTTIGIWRCRDGEIGPRCRQAGE